MRPERGIFYHLDWVMVLLYLLLVTLGWLNIYAAVYSEAHSSIFDLSQSYGKQMLWICISIVFAFIILIIDSKFFITVSPAFYGLSLFLLLVILVSGKVTAGSKSWFNIGDFGFQPAEFAKFATALFLAKYLSASNIRMQDISTRLRAGLIIAIPALLIVLQNDTGSAMVFIAFIFVLYREGLSGNIFIIGLAVISLFLLTLIFGKLPILIGIVGIFLVLFFFIKKKRREIMTFVLFLTLSLSFVFSVDFVFENVLEPHQKQRIEVLLGMETDLKDAGYNVHQSKIAIGSGGLWGKGFLNGTQTKFDFVPEQSTDFIFCTVGEEWGFAGSSLVILLYLIFFTRIIFVAERQRSRFSRIYGYGLASILFFHFFINVGMALGLLPVVGIPLPFFSYGGSSLWAFTLLLFVFIKMDSRRLDLL